MLSEYLNCTSIVLGLWGIFPPGKARGTAVGLVRFGHKITWFFFLETHCRMFNQIYVLARVGPSDLRHHHRIVPIVACGGIPLAPDLPLYRRTAGQGPGPEF